MIVGPGWLANNQPLQRTGAAGMAGEYASVDELAAAMGVDRAYVGRLLRLTLLAPESFRVLWRAMSRKG